MRLGDVIRVPTPNGDRQARVVMLGESGAHLPLDEDFVRWVREAKILAATSILIEWMDANPFTHSDPGFAPVGNYMSTTVDADVRLESRAAT